MRKVQKEIWKRVPGFGNLYEVSNLGRVKRLSHTNHRGTVYPEKILTQSISPYGYHQIRLYNPKREQHYRVHRFIALAFIPNPENKPHINHKDSNKLNNDISNLEWCTHAENMIHHQVSSGKSKFKPMDIKIIREACKKFSLLSISRYYKVHKTTIEHINSGVSWKNY